MGLLGKTLKGRSTIRVDQGPPRNTRIREIIVQADQIEKEKENRMIKLANFKKQMISEEKINKINKKKLLKNWRNIMRIAKTEKLKSELEIYAQSNQRELDSKEAFLQMLDKNLEEVEEQYNLALRNHLIQIEQLVEIRNSRTNALKSEFKRSAKILFDEFNSEANEIMTNHQRQLKELTDMTECVKEEDKQKENIIQDAFKTRQEQTRQKAKEEIEIMQNEMRSKQSTLSNALETLYQRYMNDTKDNFDKFNKFLEDSVTSNKEIINAMKNIARKKESIKFMSLKIKQMEIEFKQRNNALENEKKAISDNFLDLKNKMAGFRNGERKKLTILVLNSKACMESLTNLSNLGGKILKTAELCRRLETEREKIVPFYESTVTEDDIPEDLRIAFTETTPEQYRRFSYVKNYFKRYNKVMLDKLAIQQQKEIYLAENQNLKRMLKEYIDNISVNDDVMNNDKNPLLVTNKARIEFPIQGMKVGAQDGLVIEGNAERNNLNKQKRLQMQ